MCSKETCYVTMIQLLTSGAYRNSSKLAESKLASNVMLFLNMVRYVCIGHGGTRLLTKAAA
jgi:hypothetical protein